MKKGFTLIEVIIVAGIVSVISVGIYLALSSAKQSWDTAEIRTALQLDLRKAVYRMSDDLRQTSMDHVFTDPTLFTKFLSGNSSSELYFKVPQGINNATGLIIWNSTAVGYKFDAGTGTIIRNNGTTQVAIASDITKLNFTRINNSDVIQIDVSAQRMKAVEHGNATVNATLESAATVRN